MSMLVKYEAARRALAEAVSADEVMHIRLEAKAIEAIARAASDVDLEVNAAKLRIRAEAKLGMMLAEAERAGILRAGRPTSENGSAEEPLSRIKLKEIGVEKKLSARAQKLNALGEQCLEQTLARFDQESHRRGRLAMDVVLSETATRNAQSRRQIAQDLSDNAALSPTGRKFPLLYADPPWRRKAGIGNRAYENHHITMDWADLMAMPVKDRLLPDAWGFIWIPRAHLLALVEVETETSLGRARVKMPLAWALAQAWGFDAYSTCFIWTKTDEDRPEDHGLGLIVWDQDEVLCLFKRGRGLPKPDTGVKVGSNHREGRGAHSAKPAYYREMINAMTGGLPVLELFAREDAEHPLLANFYTWGNESQNTAELPTESAGACSSADEPASQQQPLSTPDAGSLFESADVAVADVPARAATVSAVSARAPLSVQ